MKPILKWDTGKKKFSNEILALIPNRNEYFLHYIGGGSILFSFLRKNQNKKIYAFDPNSALICFYHYFQNYPNELWNKISLIIKIYNQSKREEQEEFYYQIRKLYNEINFSLYFATFFYFLNKTGYKGLYRESKKGFNVPFGFYPKIILDEKYFFEVSKLIKDVIFISEKEILNKIKGENFIFVDLPHSEKNNEEEIFIFLKQQENFLLKCFKTDLFYDFFNTGFYYIKNLNDKEVLVCPKDFF